MLATFNLISGTFDLILAPVHFDADNFNRDAVSIRLKVGNKSYAALRITHTNADSLKKDGKAFSAKTCCATPLAHPIFGAIR